MSLILDALRKSEAERRRGQAPDLYAELPPLVPRTVARRPAWPWWLAGAVALLATLWMLRDVQTMAGSANAPAADAAAPLSAPPPDAAPVVITAQAPVATPAVTTVIAPKAPNPTAVPAVREPVATTAMPAAATAEPPPAPPAPVTEPVPPPRPSPVQVASATPPPATAPAPVTAPATAAAPLRLADLSAGEREQLPALKISMHMWGPTPDQRFAIIDGARVGQGDRVGDAVVEEIGADSVVLSWHGQRLALPIR